MASTQSSSCFFLRSLPIAVCVLTLIGVPHAFPQTTEVQNAKTKFHTSTDLSLGAYGQLTPTRMPTTNLSSVVGDYRTQITQGTSSSAGVLGTFHQSFKPWLGYNVNLGYGRFSENYSAGAEYIPNTSNGGQFPPPIPPNNPSSSFSQGSIGTNMYEVTVAYVVEGPKTKRLTTFGQLGGGGLWFLPTQDPSPYKEQVRASMVFGAGINYELTEHLDVRAEYRGLFYKNPDFAYYSGNAVPISRLFTVTSEPTVSVVYRFGGEKKTRYPKAH